MFIMFINSLFLIKYPWLILSHGNKAIEQSKYLQGKARLEGKLTMHSYKQNLKYG